MANVNRYASVHENTKGPGDARPTALQIIKDYNLEGDGLKGKVAFVTGASSGIGIHTALALQAAGAHVFAGVRNISKGEAALGPNLKPGSLELIYIDNSSLSSVRSAAQAFLSKSTTLNILINNAGIMATPYSLTADGYESQMATNHLSHFLLFHLLKPTLLSSATPSFPSRVINVSSTGHRRGPFNFTTLHHKSNPPNPESYDPYASYGQSKLANIYTANSISRRYGNPTANLYAFSLHPGGIWTGLQDHLPELKDSVKGNAFVDAYMKSPEQGAATTIWAAVADDLNGKGGLYLEECQISRPVEEGYNELSSGHEKYVYDEEAEEKVWKLSCEIVGVENE